MEIPEDIGCLSSLEKLFLSGNKFKSLPKSIKHLSKLEILSLSDCNMLQSLTELPVALRDLRAINCKQLCLALPDASEFKLCMNLDQKPDSKFLFTNCFNIDQKAVSNVFVESLKGSEEPPTIFTIFLPGSEIPNCFSYQSSGSSVNIPVLRQALVNRKFMGFATCAVLEFEEFHDDHSIIGVGVSCYFETCGYYTNILPYYQYDFDTVFIDSDHIVLQYYSFSKFYSLSQNLEKNGSDYVDISVEFHIDDLDIDDLHYKVKCCAVYPKYAKPIEVIGATIEDIGETSGRKRDRSDDNEDQVEPHPKGICTQAPNQTDAPNQQSRTFICFSLRAFCILSTIGILFYYCWMFVL